MLLGLLVVNYVHVEQFDQAIEVVKSNESNLKLIHFLRLDQAPFRNASSSYHHLYASIEIISSVRMHERSLLSYPKLTRNDSLHSTSVGRGDQRIICLSLQ